MPESEGAARGAATPVGGWPDLPLIVEQLQDQLDGLREVVEAQQRQLAEHRARLEALEHR